MSDDKRRSIRIELTEEQRKQIKTVSGEDVTALEFTPEDLEQRIAPMTQYNFISSWPIKYS
jgi:DNA-binding MarR family transcriptional regulator